jgi:hypothetical protein
MSNTATAAATMGKLNAMRSDLIGKLVTARAASDNRPIYGKVESVDLCIAPFPQCGWFRVTVENRGLFVPCDSKTVAIYANA